MERLRCDLLVVKFARLAVARSRARRVLHVISITTYFQPEILHRHARQSIGLRVSRNDSRQSTAARSAPMRHY